ncbi:MAG: type II secretion system F family protein [Nitriliruptorales bacterium]|nr:type II secretion system F family protein [Nitriliruptorales bacterium]
MTGIELAAPALLTAVAVGSAVRHLARPTRRLAGRTRPYTIATRTRLGRPADARAIGRTGSRLGHGGTLGLSRSLAAVVSQRFGHLLDGASEEALASKLRRAGVFAEVPASRRVLEYRARQLAAAAGWGGFGILAGVVLGRGAVGTVGLLLAGLVAGVARTRAAIDKALAERRDRMRVELYTVNQLLAMNIRVGGGIVQAVRRVVERGRGEVVAELREILRSHASGMTAREAFLRAAAETPDPSVTRTYRLLAAGTEYGADLADALLAHSEDLREERREALRRAATRRRAATLLPIIGVLAPVMLLLVAAPLPSIVFSLP